MSEQPKKKYVLHHRRAPGDSLVLSAAIRSLHLAYPGEFEIGIDATAADELYLHNPDVRLDMRADEGKWSPIEYDSVNRCNQTPVTFMEAFCVSLSHIVEKPLTLMTNRPHIVLSEEEMGWTGRVEELVGRPIPYAVINAGFKHDYTVKGWGHSQFQELVNRTKDRIQWVQIGTSNEFHRPLNGVINQIDRTSIRELIRLVEKSVFGVGPTTLLQHIAAAFQKPYIALLSGMEPLSWSSPYPTQISLSAHGRLPCCRNQACWVRRVVPLKDNSPNDNSLCVLPTFNGSEFVPACMSLITVDRVVEAVTQVLTFKG